ncbi:MAG: hypothetical protein E7A44_03090 [Peptoniphilus harei]|nr:hypothetical protein [Peptoniphilus harei]
MVKRVKIPNWSKSELAAIKSMQDRLNDIYKVKDSNISAMASVIEKMGPMISSMSAFNENIKPIVEKQMEINNLIKTSSIPISAFQQLAAQQDVLKTITARSISAYSKEFEIIKENQALFSDVAASLSSVYKELAIEDKQRFEELDKSQSKEEVKEFEAIVGTDKTTKKVPISYLIFMFFIILQLVSFGKPEEVREVESQNIVEANPSPIYKGLITSIVFDFVYDILKIGYVKFKCYIKNGTTKDSKNIVKIDINQEIYIVGEDRYYYKTIYHNEKGEIEEGFVAKRNIKLVERLK